MRHRFETLDLLRGLAALAILARHFPWPGNHVQILPHSYLAVDLFFVLSGFVIAHAYQERLARGLSLPRFFAVRLIRLYPAYALATLIGGGAMLAHIAGAGQPGDLGRLAASLGMAALFLPTPPPWSVDPSSFFPLDYPAWSLFWELAVNLLYAALAPRLGAKVLTALIGAGACLVIVSAAESGTLDLGSDWETGLWAGGRALFGFFAGVGVFRVFSRHSPPSVPGWALGTVLLLLLWVPDRQGSAYDIGCVLILFPLVVWLGANARNGDAVGAAGRKLGYLSYPIYVFQAPVAYGLAGMLHRVWHAELPDRPWLGFPAYIALVIACSWAAARWFDDPVRRALNRRFAAGRPVTAAQTAP